MNINNISTLIKYTSRPRSDRYLAIISMILLTGTAIMLIVATFAPELLLP